MSLESACPGCATKVRIPESLLGKRVKCPKCAMIFTAEEPDAGFEEVRDDEEEVRPRRRRAAPINENDRDDDYDARPGGRRRIVDDEDDDEYDRPPRRRGSRRVAEEAVKAPAIAMMVVGGLGFLIAILTLILFAKGALPDQRGANIDAARETGHYIGLVLIFMWGIIVPYAGFMMMSLRNYSSVMIGVIFAMLPCNLACFLGIPLGIWAIAVMSRPEVKRAFR
jgi:predicted Zn finger-like uncharacterized protein